MKEGKLSRKEITAKILDKLQAALGELDADGSKKVRKSLENTAKKLAKRFSASLDKAEKKTKSATKTAEKKANKVKRVSKEVIIKAAKAEKAPAETGSEASSKAV